MVITKLVFNDTSVVPATSDVAATMTEAVSSNSSNFSLPVNTASIVATSKTHILFALVVHHRFPVTNLL